MASAPLVFAPTACLDHDPGEHPESRARLESILALLDDPDVKPLVERREAPPAREDDLLLVHERSYVDAVRRACEAGGGALDPDTVVSRGSYAAALASCGAVIAACDAVLAGPSRRAFCAVRPPGHHASPGRAMGFCLFNHVAVGARHLRRRRGVERVLIVDFDVHHGNGTEAIFAADEAVFYASIHRWPFYPGTGGPDAPPARATLDVPLGAGTSREEFRERFTDLLGSARAAFRADFVLASAGFDAFARDPIGGLGLEAEDFGFVTEELLRLADEDAGGRFVAALEGGYSRAGLAECVAAHLRALAGPEAR